MATKQQAKKPNPNNTPENRYYRALRGLPLVKNLTSWLKDNDLWVPENTYRVEVLQQGNTNSIHVVGYDNTGVIGFVILSPNEATDVAFKILDSKDRIYNTYLANLLGGNNGDSEEA